MDLNGQKQLVTSFLITKDELLFKELYRLYTDDLYRLAVKLNNGDNMLAEDIVQETWIRAISKLHEFKWQSGLKTWLSGIVINCSREANRRAPARDLSEVSLSLRDDTVPRLENTMDLKKVLAALPDGYKEVIVMHDLEGYKHEEIGQILGISAGTSKSQLFNARKAIKKLIYNHSNGK